MSHLTAAHNLMGPGSRWWLLAALLSGFGLRLHRLGAESLWYDETVSAVLARKQVAELIAHTAGDIHPPGYYLLLHGWQAWTRPTPAHGLEFLLAYFSLAFGIVVLALLYAVGRLWFDRTTVTIAVWIAAFSPFHLWYSQEVRMYTLGAALGLLALWLTIKLWSEPAHAVRWAACYALAAAASLYVLYYAVFLLVALNLVALIAFIRSARGNAQQARRSLLFWSGAQLAALLLWLPWLPVFLHQIAEPPVPPWRQPWQDLGDLSSAATEALSALLVGQSPPLGAPWLWAGLTLLFLVFALYAYAKGAAGACPNLPISGITVLLLYVLAPAGLIFAITLLGTPIYHVRYLFTYAPPFALLAAAAVTALGRRQRWAGAGLLAGILAISIWSVVEFWTNPLYRSDDHRTAVAELARNWRPGDVILANAGWNYTILETYWPAELIGAQAALPPPLAAAVRLPDHAAELDADQCARDGLSGGTATSTETAPTVARTGSLDGDASLGWGDPKSDFFATSPGETARNLAQLAQCYRRLWHFRLYDTVSDAHGVIRSWLADNAEQDPARTYPGRDYLQVELHHLQPAASPSGPAMREGTEFGGVLRLVEATVPTTITAGTTLYAGLDWLPLAAVPEPATEPADLSMSLRLYDAAGAQVAQRDEAPWQPSSSWPAGAITHQGLALDIPAALPPGDYSLELIVYRQADGQPLAAQGGAHVIGGQRLQLGAVASSLPDRPPEVGSPLASFDYVDLLQAQPARERAVAGDDVGLLLTWRPRPSPYRDAYAATVDLVSADGQVAQSWSAPVGGPAYPSSAWPAGYPVLDRRTLALPPDLAPGEYGLRLRLARASDGLVIPARRRFWPISTESVEIGRLHVGS